MTVIKQGSKHVLDGLDGFVAFQCLPDRLPGFGIEVNVVETAKTRRNTCLLVHINFILSSGVYDCYQTGKQART